MKISSVLPKEHGAWGVLFIPFFVSAAVASCFDLKMILLLFGIFFLYISRKSIEELFRASKHNDRLIKNKFYYFLIIFITVGLLFIIPIFLLYDLTWLPAFGFIFICLQWINILQIRKRKQRTVTAELIGIAGLCLSAPIAYYVATGEIEKTALLMWIISFAYFARGVLYVKLRLSVVAARAQFADLYERMKYSKGYIFFHLALITSTFFLLIMFQKPFLIISYLPIAIQSFLGISRMNTKLNVPRIGYIEVSHSILFGILVVLLFDFNV